MTSPVILVTGGAGYIGSHAVRALQQAGYTPVVLDNLVYGHRRIVDDVLRVPLVVGQVGDRALLDQLLSGQHPATDGLPIQAVLHFAAYAYVGESMTDPAKYYRNNVGDSLTLLEALKAEGERRATKPLPLVFSSSCATYGIPAEDQIPIAETCPQQPINPYGRSKLMVEQIVSDFASAYGLPSVIFRYFNAAGADPVGDLGEDHTPETHLIPLVFAAMTGRLPQLKIFGTDYSTPDGTCIRDYIHVCDLADAHVLGLQKLLATSGQYVFNLGNGTGYSVEQVIDTAKEVTGLDLFAHEASRRLGDPPVLLASSEHAHRELGWKPNYPDLSTIIGHAWKWYQGLHSI
ncbi:UDP-glucose 4-epimerase GalE [Synechococcus sp. AH-736-G20]|nr:UDP-glucose 4-epimerase GalE [Synechococcus sp. AH-736-G20]